MDLTQLRKDFSIFVVDGDYTVAKSVAETLIATGYEDTRFFPTTESALAVARDVPPHLVLFDHEKLEAETESFLRALRDISPEILVILMVSPAQLLAALQLVGRGLAFDSVVRPLVSTLELVQKVDRGAGRLAYQFESEQLREHFERGAELEPRGDGHAVGAALPLKGGHDNDRWVIVSQAVERLASTLEIDQSVQIFMESLSRLHGETPMLYLRYLPSHMSLVISQAAWLPLEKFRGVGLDLKKVEAAELSDCFRHPAKLPGLSDMVGEVFRRSKFTAFPHVIADEVLGLFVVLDEVDVDTSATPERALKKAFELAYQRGVAVKEKHALDSTDPLTGLLNRRFFGLRLDEEISRSRRIMMPVSMITLDIDGAKALAEKLGSQQVDSIMKMLAAILKKTARTNDVLARTGPDEFSMLLPHTGHMGAAVKAERARRVIEAAKFPVLQARGLGPLTVSCGVSEYPSFSSDAESLMRTTDEALQQVKTAGGNRTCLATAPEGFQLDFTPRDVPSWGGVHRESGQ